MDQFSFFIENIGRPKVIKNYLKIGNKNIDINNQDELGNTLLHYAASIYDYEITKLLLDLGANPNIVNNNFELPLKVYIENHNYKPAFELLKCELIDLNVVGMNEHSILHDAIVYNCDISFVKKLHKYGCALDIVDESNSTPLHLAVECGNIKAADFILSMSENRYIKNNLGKTPLDIAIEMNNKRMQNLFAKYNRGA